MQSNSGKNLSIEFGARVNSFINSIYDIQREYSKVDNNQDKKEVKKQKKEQDQKLKQAVDTLLNDNHKNILFYLAYQKAPDIFDKKTHDQQEGVDIDDALTQRFKEKLGLRPNHTLEGFYNHLTERVKDDNFRKTFADTKNDHNFALFHQFTKDFFDWELAGLLPVEGYDDKVTISDVKFRDYAEARDDDRWFTTLARRAESFRSMLPNAVSSKEVDKEEVVKLASELSYDTLREVAEEQLSHNEDDRNNITEEQIWEEIKKCRNKVNSRPKGMFSKIGVQDETELLAVITDMGKSNVKVDRLVGEYPSIMEMFKLMSPKLRDDPSLGDISLQKNMPLFDWLKSIEVRGQMFNIAEAGGAITLSKTAVRDTLSAYYDQQSALSQKSITNDNTDISDYDRYDLLPFVYQLRHDVSANLDLSDATKNLNKKLQELYKKSTDAKNQAIASWVKGEIEKFPNLNDPQHSPYAQGRNGSKKIVLLEGMVMYHSPFTPQNLDIQQTQFQQYVEQAQEAIRKNDGVDLDQILIPICDNAKKSDPSLAQLSKKGGAFKLLQLLLVKSAQNPEKIIVQSTAGDTRKRPKAEPPIPDSQLALLNTGAGGPPVAVPPAAGAPGVAAPVAAGAAGDNSVLFSRVVRPETPVRPGPIARFLPAFVRDGAATVGDHIPDVVRSGCNWLLDGGKDRLTRLKKRAGSNNVNI